MLRAADVAPREMGYVGSQACATCHEAIFEQYAATPMGQSLAAIDQAAPVGDEPEATITPPGNRIYKVSRDASGVVHTEISLDQNGDPLFESAEHVQYALGSGKRGRSYLISRGGRLFQSPIGWYSQSERWDLSPGYAPHNHPRFSRRIGDGCLYCHAGQMQHHVTVEGFPAEHAARDHYQEPIFAEAAIGCERCHGPGERHVQFHSDGATTALADPIVNPARLEPAKRESVCNQCHLLGQSVIPRCGRGFFDFRPGDALEDVFVVLSEPTESTNSRSAMRAVSQVDQMRVSRCYQGSQGALGCISCHDPHATPAPEQRIEFFRQRCNECHASEGCSEDLATREQAPANNSCIHCHMPQGATKDVPHTAMTDHRILRQGLQDAPDAKDQEPGPMKQLAEWIVFDNADQRLPKAEVDRAKGIALMTLAWDRKDPHLAAQAQAHLFQALGPLDVEDHDYLKWVDDAPLLQELGVGYMLLGNSDATESCWKRLLEINPYDETALTGLAKAAESRSDRQTFRAMIERLNTAHPDSEEVVALRVKLKYFSGDRAGAAEEAEHALKLNPTLVELRQWLVDLYQHLGEEAKAAQHRKLLERMPTAKPDPDRLDANR
jgi:hypothetical protein